MSFKCIAKDVFITSLQLYLNTDTANINKEVLNLQAHVQKKMEFKYISNFSISGDSF